MAHTMHVAISSFALRLIFGMNLMLCVMPREKVPSAFFRIILLVELGLAVLFALTSPAMLWWGIGLGVIAFVGSVLWLLERRRAGTAALRLILLLSLIGMNLLPNTSATGAAYGSW